VGLSHPPAVPGTASIALSPIGRHQVGLLTFWEATERPDSLVAAEEKLIDISIFVCACILFDMKYKFLLCLPFVFVSV
jgi:hypothetical protein